MARMEPPTMTAEPMGSPGKMPPPGSPEEPAKADGAKASPEEAGVVLSDKHCVDCRNWSPETGECAKVEGTFDPEDACSAYFEPDHDESAETPKEEGAEVEAGMEKA